MQQQYIRILHSTQPLSSTLLTVDHELFLLHITPVENHSRIELKPALVLVLRQSTKHAYSYGATLYLHYELKSIFGLFIVDYLHRLTQ